METEIWKIIPEYEQYEASTYGNIRNTRSKKILQPFHVENAYSQVRLSLGSRSEYKVCRVHRLIAQTWIPNMGNKPTVNHMDRNHFNNAVNNLEWNTYEEQSIHHAKTQLKDKKIVKFAPMQNDFQGEIWKLIPSHKDYQVSNFGRIKGFNGKVLLGHASSRYIQIRTSTSHFYVHRVVAEAFLPNFDPINIINHKDGNRYNNLIGNLECITQQNNTMHAYDENLNKRRVKIQQFTMQGEFIKEFKSITEAAKNTGFKDACIRYRISYSNGEHGGYIWKRIDREVIPQLENNLSTTKFQILNNKNVNVQLYNHILNSKTDTRRDKKDPPSTLIDIGIKVLPKHIRWDKYEKKFIIYNHPQLIYEVERGIRKQPVMSCTKMGDDIIYKFNDALERYQKLDEILETHEKLNT